MAHRRFTIDLAIPEVIPPVLLKTPTSEELKEIGEMTWFEIFENLLKKMHAYSEKINTGNKREEDTMRIAWHICRHADGLPCDQEQVIK